jgi:hypothetical protein
MKTQKHTLQIPSYIKLSELCRMLEIDYYRAYHNRLSEEEKARINRFIFKIENLIEE